MSSAVTAPDGPLTGVTVLDLTHVINGPFATRIMADLGARVIKVEPPGHGDDTRTYEPFHGDESIHFSFVNRGKESIVLNLKDEADRTIFLNMVKKADVLTENFRPGAMDRLGFSYEVLSKINPRLIYASSAGFGQTGPLSQHAAYDTIIQAMSGLMLETGFPGGPPVRAGTSISDLCGGIYLFSAVSTALYAREKTGKGSRVDIAMFDATLAFLEHGLMHYVATGKAPERIGNRHPYIAPFDVFKTSDSYVAICCGNDPLFASLCNSIGAPELAKDARFVHNEDRIQNVDALKAAMEKKLLTDTTEAWVVKIDAAGVPVGPMLNVAQAMQLPQTAARNMLIQAGDIQVPGNPIKISGYADPKVRGPAPKLDEHGASLRREFSA